MTNISVVNARQPLTAGAAAGPFEVGFAVADRGLAQLRAGVAAGARRERRRLLAHLPERDQVVDAAVDGELAVVGAVHLDEVAHLVQARPHTVSDAEQE